MKHLEEIIFSKKKMELVRECPFGMIQPQFNIWGDKTIAYVGNTWCSHHCPHNCGGEDKGSSIYCKHPIMKLKV